MSDTPNAKHLWIGLAESLGAATLFVLVFVSLINAGGDWPLAMGGMFLVFGIGLTQILWIGPLIWRARRRGRARETQGPLIGAGIVALLNAACFGAVWQTFGLAWVL